MAVEIRAIERSRRVDSQAWSFFFSTRPRRKVMTSQSRAILGKSRIFEGFVLEIQSASNRQCLWTGFQWILKLHVCARDSESICDSMRLGPFLNCQSQHLMYAKKYYIQRNGPVHFDFCNIPSVGAQYSADTVENH